jgi:molybdopterin-guanine dinucleotide biosynthesis protein A
MKRVGAVGLTYPDLAAVLLAGGRSLRMGRDKSLLRIGEQSILHLLAGRLRELSDQVFLSTGSRPANGWSDVEVIHDRYPGRGPIAGLHAALLQTARPKVLLLACDLPGVSTVLLRHLVDRSPGFDAVIPVTSDGRSHPACAVYSRNCLPVVEACLKAGENRLLRVAEDPRLRALRLRLPDELAADVQLLNVNSPEDLTAFLRRQNS